MVALNTPEMELFAELNLVVSGRGKEVVDLVEQGWGVYVDVLNTLIALGEPLFIHQIMLASRHEKYEPEDLKCWMEAYYEHNWKHAVVEFGFRRIAKVFFSAEEYAQAGF